MHAHLLTNPIGKTHAARLALILDRGMYSSDHSLRWFYPAPDAQLEPSSIRSHLGHNQSLLYLSKMPSKGKSVKLERYSESLFGSAERSPDLTFVPNDARLVLRSLAKSDPLLVQAYDRCARLYNVSLVCGRIYPSVGLAYRVAAVEAIVKTTGKYSSFSDFVRRYSLDLDASEAMLGYMYGDVRSAHFHSGEFPLGEYPEQISLFGPILDPEYGDNLPIARKGAFILRSAVIRWIQDNIVRCA
jgi:hypothetical protein